MSTLVQTYSYPSILETAQKINWRVEDIIGGDRHLDFSRPFLPESLAGVEAITCLNPAEKLLLNQIRSNSYLVLFGIVEEFIVPAVLGHVQTLGTDHIVALQAFLCFAEEEGKHIELFRRFQQEFEGGFGTPCPVIGPAQAIAAAILNHGRLGVALAILHIEWMTQRHYLDSIRDNQSLDPQFCSLLKHHWLEEAQHTKLDTLMIDAIAQDMDESGIQQGIADYFAICEVLDQGLIQQVQLDLDNLQQATGRTFTPSERQEIQSVQEQAYRLTFIASGMSHPNFIQTLRQLNESAATQALEQVAALS